MGVLGVEILINKIEKADLKMANQIVIEEELIIRKSCGYYFRGYVR